VWLVWVVIPLVLIVSIIGIVGIQESFAQIYELSDYPGEWYVGEGLKQGDYFEYSLCHVDYNDCAPIKLKMWIKGTIPYESETLWDAKMVVYDDDKIIKGSMGLGKIAPEPVIFDDDIFDYAIMFKASVTWLSAYVTSNEGIHGPRQFSDKTWGSKWTSIGTTGGPYPLRAETITIPAGTFDTVVVGSNPSEHYYNDVEFWIVDDFPFPVKAVMHTLWSTDNSEKRMLEFEYELLYYQENVMDNPFKDVVVPEPPEKLLGCPTEFSDYVSKHVLTNTSSMLIQYDYSPEFPIEGCNIDWKINFLNKYNDAEFIDQVHYDIWVVDENGNKLRSYAENLGRNNFWNGFGQVNHLIPIEENAGLVQYAIFIHGTGPKHQVPDPKLRGYVTVEIEIKENPFFDESFVPETEFVKSPKQQLRNGILFENIICKEELELVFKSSDNSPACVKESTAKKLIQRGWLVLPVIWIERTMAQCEDAWLEKAEQWWKENPNGKYSTEIRKQWITEFYTENGVNVLDVKFAGDENFSGIACEACYCTSGQKIMLKIDDPESPLLSEGYWKKSVQ